MALVFSTKAGTLIALQGLLKTARIAPMHVFTVAEWLADRSLCISGIQRLLGADTWIVRSSCHLEDGLTRSNAGAYLSIPDVKLANLESAVEKVIISYGEAQPTDEVLIQPMLINVERSGVAFSHDPNTCAPYRVVNWLEGRDTTAVTSGMGGRLWQQAAHSFVCSIPNLKPIVALLDELLSLFNNVPTDCEFAVTRESGEEILWLLQARPLILPVKSEPEEVQAARLESIQRKIERGMQQQPFLMGQRTVYGVMPDWNPAEIIGIRPKPLALSLYRELITDSIWAYQRHNYGYRNLRSFPLMTDFFGLPYIDVRLSFNSFIPEDLDETLAGRLVDHYIERLLAEPTLHDKVEFDIVFSCYTLDLPQRLERLAEAGFSKQERDSISHSLRKLTNHIVQRQGGLWQKDAAKLNILNARREELLASSADPLERIYWLLEDVKRYGTLPFAGLARAGFVAVQMLKSLVAVGVFSQADYDAFISGVLTVNGQLERDRSTQDKETFLQRYGHLRPGTYDILSPRYDKAPELYFDWSRRSPILKVDNPFTLTSSQMTKILKLQKDQGLQSDVAGLFDFIKAAIELRELSKFDFTRNLSDVLELIAEVGSQYGFCREDLAYCNISVFKELHLSVIDPKEALLHSMRQGKERYAETLKISLPPLITKPEDVWSFEWSETSPNFITQKQVTAPPVVMSFDVREQLAGALVCIPNADPGFDWLFAFPIAGLITAWGGPNSHMAIRAGELELPAVIGAGEVLYRRWSSAKRLHLDCGGRKVDVLA